MWKLTVAWIKSNFPIFILLSVLAIVTWKNYPWATSFLGWDSVQPEIDFGMNMKRALTSVWVGNQGLGHIGGHGYATILIQGMIEWAMSMVVGVAQTRGLFIFTMLWLGPIGIYFLCKKWFNNTGKFASWGAMLSGLFYLLNLGTVQVFFAPLEAFNIFYGLLPWAILSIVYYLTDPSKKNLILMLIAQFIFSLIGFIPPQFIAYGMMVLVLLAGYMIEKRKDMVKAFKRALTVGTILLVSNLYWLMPVGYYSMHGASSYAEAKNNQVSTPDFQYMSEARGRWDDVALMRGFFIDSSDSVIKGEGKFFEIFESWNDYLKGDVLWVGYGLFGVSMIGLLMMIAKKGKRSQGIGLLLILAIGFVAIAQAEEPFTTIANFMHQIPVVGQAFRAAFTKFVGLLIFVYSIGFGYGIYAIYKSMREKLIAGTILIMIGVGSLIFYMWPMFSGSLIYGRMKVNMPSEYGQLMKFFKIQDRSSRIAYLPSAWMWGWQVHEWGYSGSGFLWYGIEQPILDRAFDVWSPYNETFYSQFSTALYGGDKDEVEKVVRQYDVKYVLLDESIIAPGQDKEILRIDETKNMASELGWERVFNENFLSVYQIPIGSDPVSPADRLNISADGRDLLSGSDPGQQGITAPSTYTLANGDAVKTREDVAYKDVGTHVSNKLTNQQTKEIIYPFAGLMKEEIGKEHGTLNIEYRDEVTTLRSELGDMRADDNPPLQIPGWKVGDIVRIDFKDDKPLPAYIINGQDGPVFLGKEKPEEGQNYLVAKVSEDKEWSEYLEDKKFDLRGETLKVEVAGEPVVYDFATQGNAEVKNCDVLGRGNVSKVGNKYIADGRGSVCDYVVMKELDTRLSYVMRMRGENVLGRSVKFFLYNTWSKRNDIEYLLGKDKFDQTFSLMPWSTDGFYTLNIDVRSFGQKTVNVLGPVEVRYLPLEQIAGARIESQSSDHSPIVTQGSELKIAGVKKIGTWLYIVETKNAGLLRLSQGYDEGWVSPWVEHVKVDGWANGWMVPGSVTIVIFYWPQLLEYLGFGLLGLTVILLIMKRK